MNASRDLILCSLRLHGRIAYMFTGELRTRSLDAMDAIGKAHATDAFIQRHIARYVSLFSPIV